jgi:hypothetical protein
LKRAKKEDWVEVVVQDWFVSGNAENADHFFERAETFLQKGETPNQVWNNNNEQTIQHMRDTR